MIDLDPTVVKILCSCSLAWLLSQTLKIALYAYHQKRCNWSLLMFAQGGMPSSHTAFVTTLALCLLLEEGLSTTSLVATAYAIVTVRDAIGVRHEVGLHARVLNALAHNTGESNNNTTTLDESVGHTPIEAIGGALVAIFSVAITFAVYR